MYVLMWIINIIQFFSYLPQLHKLLKTKKSDDLSLLSWAAWLTTALCWVIYSIFELKDFWSILTCSLELLFILSTFLLTIKYRNNYIKEGK